MGKAKRLKISKESRNEALEQQISREDFATSKEKVKVSLRMLSSFNFTLTCFIFTLYLVQKPSRNEKSDEFVDDKLSVRILRQAQQQQQELEGEFGTSIGTTQKVVELFNLVYISLLMQFVIFYVKITSQLGESAPENKQPESDSESSDIDDAKFYDDIVRTSNRVAQISFFTVSIYVYYSITQEVDEEEEKALALFMNTNPLLRKTLADIIMEKITEKQTEIQSQFSEVDSKYSI